MPGHAEAKRAANARALQGQSSTKPREVTPTLPTSLVFEGPNQSRSSTPPDPVIAAGPNHVLVAVNSLLAIYDKSGVQQGGFQDLAMFFAGLGVSGEVFDPRVIYDQADGRFILSAAEVDMSNFTNGHVLLAVSQTSDPTAGWFKFAFDFKGRSLDNTGDTFPDAPSVGVGPTAVYLTSDQFEFNAPCLSGAGEDGCKFSDAWIKVIGLRELLAGSPVLSVIVFKGVQTASNNKAFGLQPALTYGPAGAEFLVAANFAVDPNATLDLFSIDAMGNLDAVELAVPSFSTPPDAPQGGTSEKIDTNDFHMLNAVWANGSLWTGHNVASADGTNPVARWYQIQLSDLPSAALVQSGEVAGDGAAYYPVLAAREDGTVGMSFTTSSVTSAASAAFSLRGAADPLGAMRSHAVYHPGSGPYDEGGGNRWGDYSGASADPDGSGFWAIAEYAGTPDPRFGTAITRVSVAASPDFALVIPVASASVRSGGTATFQVTGIAINGLATPVVFSCSNLPANAACSFSPASLALANAVLSTSTLTVSTSAIAAANTQSAAGRRLSLGTVAAVGLMLGVCMLTGPGGRRRRLFTFLIIIFMLSCVSCGGGGAPSADSLSAQMPVQSTAPGSYSITVNAQAGGTLQHSLPITLTVN